MLDLSLNHSHSEVLVDGDHGFETLASPMVALMLLIGVIAGMIVGSISGINDNIAFAVFIPFSFAMPPEQALALMVGVYCAAATGGAIPAIVIKALGTASSCCNVTQGASAALSATE